MKKEQANPKALKNKYIPSAEFYSQIIDSLQDYSIFTMNTELIINSWSSGSTNIFGYETDEMIGESFDIVFTEEDKKNGIPQLEIDTALKEGKAVDNRWHLCKDGSIFYAYGLVFPLMGKDGELLGYVKILRDLTERRKSEEAIKNYIKDLQELNTHKESILAILSHDLRSPLGAIIGMADYLKSDFDNMEPEDVKRMLDNIYKASNDELMMLDYLLEWARIKYASEVFSPRKIALVDYIEKVFETLNEVAAINNINLHHEVEENIRVFADEKMVLSVLQNIVSNAIKHSHQGGKITVTAKRSDDKMIIQIKDTGQGMSKQIQDKLFTPQIYALSNARKENTGAGIGLLLVKGFLEKNGGEIWVESVEGEGSSFYFTLPIEQPTGKIESADEIEFDENA
ncbi:MAG TPA: PAS domain-containing sensor histidine kinase [Prolixibacteraceae bacterium]|jgi:two-component system CheB/CheR fusion protein